MKHLLIITSVILVLVGLTWGFVIHPRQVRQHCNIVGVKHAATAHLVNQEEVYNLNYEACLHKHGL